MNKYYVVVKSFKDKEYRKVISEKPMALRMAEKVERGLNINLNHNDYYTELEISR